MKVAYLLGSLNRGGAETLVLDIFKTKNSGLRIIGIHRKKGLLYDEFKKSNVPLIPLYPRNIFDISYFFKLRKILKHENIRIMHSHQVIDAIYSYIATLGLPIKSVLTLHGHGLKDVFFARLLRIFVIKSTDLNAYVSKSLMNHYLNEYCLSPSRNHIVLYNGISFKKLENTHIMPLKKELNIQESSILLGTVGNFTSGRDLLTICRFLVLLKKQNQNFHFIFVGAKSNAEPWIYDESYQYCMKSGISDLVSFLGARDDVPNILQQLDAFIYSTAHDTFGIAVIEAIATGTPVFVNDWVVMNEITGNGELATIYKSKDEKDLFHHFNLFLNHPKNFREKAKKAALVVKKKYSIENHINGLKTIYQSLLT